MAALREQVRKLSPRGEFFLVITLSLGYFIAASAYALLAFGSAR